ncbi:unnamed protein product [Adineta steineri]|uniref:VWFA domain-containing protein n=1 Tax=Adineta steineri TaxID=433720 RepID=A0A815P3P5_9BILA|nr:unnamed protein product [Adineta steineri]CAF3847766.1 unnamed protein product [Adineta steineri]
MSRRYHSKAPTGIHVGKSEQPELAEHDSSILDLAFAMDCTESMAPSIESAKNYIRAIFEEIVIFEKSDIRLAFVEYRDHPPEDTTFVTRVHNFTNSVDEMKNWLDVCQADGGGGATRICILISDAPPHGLDRNGDNFPNGCPAGCDPLRIARDMAEHRITLYAVGVEPYIVPYRDFFMTIAYITGGQYVPMINAQLLAQVIVGGVREEITLERLMQNAEADIAREIQRAEEDGTDDRETATRINHYFTSRKTRTKQMRNKTGATSKTGEECYLKCAAMSEMQSKFKALEVENEELKEDANYELDEEDMNFEQAKRIVQKAKSRK